MQEEVSGIRMMSCIGNPYDVFRDFTLSKAVRFVQNDDKVPIKEAQATRNGLDIYAICCDISRNSLLQKRRLSIIMVVKKLKGAIQ